MFSLSAVFCFASSVFAQEPQTEAKIDNDTAPPPVFSMSSDEHSQLSGETDIKRRTQLCLLLADARLKKAEDAAARDEFETALIEMGSYQAIIQNQLKFLQRNNNDSGRIRDNFRRMDITLRSHTPRVEAIRRVTPYEYAVHLKAILNFTRDARAAALDSFFSDSVLAGNEQTRQEKTSSGIQQPSSGASNQSGSGFTKEKKP